MNTIPVVDIFAGPGGLGEGFAAYSDNSKNFPFNIVLSAEMDAHAHETLRLRSFYRHLVRNGEDMSRLHDYCLGHSASLSVSNWEQIMVIRHYTEIWTS